VVPDVLLAVARQPADAVPGPVARREYLRGSPVRPTICAEVERLRAVLDGATA
jgi:hypothetical protein